MTPDLRRRYGRRFEQFMRLPHAQEALLLLGTYLHAVIPFSRRTELSFWSISCLPNNGRSGVYSRVNLNMQEVLTLEADEQGLWAHFHLARTPFEEYFGEEWQETLAHDGWNPQLHAYQPGGQDQFRLADNDPDDAKALMVWPVHSNAMSKLNLNLMRRGPNFYSNSHCLDLADAAVAAFQRRKHELIAVHELMPEDERPAQRWH